jgi:hypothetical protein
MSDVTRSVLSRVPVNTVVFKALEEPVQKSQTPHGPPQVVDLGTPSTGMTL